VVPSIVEFLAEEIVRLGGSPVAYDERGLRIELSQLMYRTGMCGPNEWGQIPAGCLTERDTI
jgi:hypothetical protein